MQEVINNKVRILSCMRKLSFLIIIHKCMDKESVIDV